MPNIPKSGYLTDPLLTNLHKRTTTGRDTINLSGVPSMTLLTIEISGSATVVVEYSEGDDVFIPVAEVTETTGIQFSVPASILATNVTAVSGYVRIIYRTIQLDNMPAQTLIVYGSALVTSPIISSADHGVLSGLSDDDHPQYVLRNILTNDGDLFMRNSGVITRLPKGTNGQVLTMVAGLPAWV